MKKITKIIPVILILIISILLLLYFNFKEASKYLNIENYQVESISLNYEKSSENINEIVQHIQSLAKKNNVILVKSNIDFERKNSYKVYLSLDNINELKLLLQKSFKIDYFNKNETSSSFVATYETSDKNQIGIIKDLFADHYYSYYLMNKMLVDNDSLYGNYEVLYKDFEDYSNFIYEVNKLVGYDTQAIMLTSSLDHLIIILMIGSIIFLFIFYFIFQIYEYYNNSKKIGCMKLLGYDIDKINQKMIQKNMKVYFYSIFIILLLIICFVQNIKLYHIIIILLINLFIILMTYVISRWSCKIINKTYQTSNILKKQNITSRISNISYKFKIVMTIMIICFSVFAFQNIDILCEKLQAYHMSKNLLDYSVLSTYIPNQPEEKDYDKQYQFYQDITNHFDTFYALFHDYYQWTEQDWLRKKQAEENGTYFTYDSVDKNYLKKEQIEVYDLNGKLVNIDTVGGIYFLFPKSKKKYIKSFEKWQLEEIDYYKKWNKDYKFKAFLYNDQKLDTYSVTADYKYIDSPILRVIDNSLRTPYFYDGLGISMFGNEITTGLKIKLIDGSKDKTWNEIEKYLDKNDLSHLFNENSFITYKDYFNDDILMSQALLTFITFIIILVLFVYTIISFQLLNLYIKGQKEIIVVKKLLGFDNDVIFEKIFKKNLINLIVAIILSLLILILIKKFNISFIIISVCLLFLDYLITFIAIKTINFSTIYLDLKGGDYD